MFLLTSVAENVWNKVPCKGPSPPALCGHAACVLDNKMYIHGGFADRVSVSVCVHCMTVVSSVGPSLTTANVVVKKPSPLSLCIVA